MIFYFYFILFRLQLTLVHETRSFIRISGYSHKELYIHMKATLEELDQWFLCREFV